VPVLPQMADTLKLLLRGRNGVEIELSPRHHLPTHRRPVMLSFSSHQRHYVYTGAVDMRKQFDGLAGVVRREFSPEVMSGDVFIFINRRRYRIKLLMWDFSGFALYYKRLESDTFERPLARAGENAIELAWPELVLLLESIKLQSVKKRKRYRQRPQA